MKYLAAPFINMIWRKFSLRRSMIACLGFAVVASAAEIAVALSLLPILASVGVDAGGDLDGFIRLIPPAGWLAVFAIAAGLRPLSGRLSAIAQEKATQEIVVSLQTTLYGVLATAHWDAVRHIAPPKITSALQAQTYEASYGFAYLIQVITAGLLIVGYLLSTAAVFPIVLPALLAVLFLLWAINVRRNQRVIEISEGYVSAHTELHQRYEDWVAISRISSLGVDVNRLTARFDADVNEAASHSIEYSRTSAATSVSYDAARVAAIVVGIPVAWWLEAPPALLAFALVALTRVLPQASGIQTGYQGIVNAVAPLQSVQQLTKELEYDQVSAPSTPGSLTWECVKLESVGVEDTAREDSQRWILRHIDLNLKSAEWLALTGPTGAGKTTLAELMLMLIRPDAGGVSVDGQLVDDELASRWRHQAAYVPQDVVLLDTSIRENLRLYVPGASDEELLNALKVAAANFVTTQLPEGLNTRVGPGGRWLSGGERQRIGIARALLRQPGFLVLDEPTAALDSDTQQELMDSLESLRGSMSVVLITHRQELLALANRVINLDNGALQ